MTQAGRSGRGVVVFLLLLAFAASLGGAAGFSVLAITSGSGEHYPVATGLDAPRGLYALPDGGLLIAEGGGRILRLTPDHELQVVTALLPTATGHLYGGMYTIGPSAVVFAGGAYYFVVGEFRDKGFREVYRYEPGGIPERLTGQDPTGIHPPNLLTNPYDLAIEPDGSLLVSDSGINAVLRVNSAGEVSRYADIAPLTGFASTTLDSVPTGLTHGPDDALYVGILSGYPHPRGAAAVYRLEDRNHDGDAMDPGETTIYADGFTAVTDVAFDIDSSLLVTEFSNDLATLNDVGYARSGEFPGKLVRWRGDGYDLEVVADGLFSPTAVAVSPRGELFVSEEFAGRIVRVEQAALLLPAFLYPLIGALLGLIAAAVARKAFRWPWSKPRPHASSTMSG